MTPAFDGRRFTFITLHSGREFNYDRFGPDDIHINDIAHALSHLCRFGGHGSAFYSVAQHSVLVSQLVPPQHALWGLLHDATEAYVVDLPRGLKHLPEMSAYRDLESRVAQAISDHFGIARKEPAEVERVDHTVVRSEAERLGLYKTSWGPLLYPPPAVLFSPPHAKQVFLRRFSELYFGRALPPPSRTEA